MKIYVGLGNPGEKYAKTRHNIGFMAIDALSEAWGIPLNQSKFNGMFGTGTVNGERVCLVKPLTYMNLSGQCVVPLMNFYKETEDNLYVIYDDLDLPTGAIRLRQKGSAGGHNGMKSIIGVLGASSFKRIRLGIGRPSTPQPVPDYVLSPFTKDEQPIVLETVKKTVEVCEDTLKQTFVLTMNKFNG
ncbi:MAG: aminoacyl-tRNA hydrolase [Bacilli bacterium]